MPIIIVIVIVITVVTIIIITSWNNSLEGRQVPLDAQLAGKQLPIARQQAIVDNKCGQLRIS